MPGEVRGSPCQVKAKPAACPSAASRALASAANAKARAAGLQNLPEKSPSRLLLLLMLLNCTAVYGQGGCAAACCSDAPWARLSTHLVLICTASFSTPPKAPQSSVLPAPAQLTVPPESPMVCPSRTNERKLVKAPAKGDGRRGRPGSWLSRCSGAVRVT